MLNKEDNEDEKLNTHIYVVRQHIDVEIDDLMHLINDAVISNESIKTGRETVYYYGMKTG